MEQSSLDESFESEKATGDDSGRSEKAEKLGEKFFLAATAEDAVPRKSSSGTKLNRAQTIAMPIKLPECSTDPPEDSNLSASLPQLVPDAHPPPKETLLHSPGKEIPKPPPTIKLPMIAGGCQIELATLEARERMLASLKERVPRVEIGVSNSPERDPPPVPAVEEAQ